MFKIDPLPGTGGRHSDVFQGIGIESNRAFGANPHAVAGGLEHYSRLPGSLQDSGAPWDFDRPTVRVKTDYRH